MADKINIYVVLEIQRIRYVSTMYQVVECNQAVNKSYIRPRRSWAPFAAYVLRWGGR